MISYDAKLKIGEILYNRTLENKVLDIYNIKEILLILNSDDKITGYLKKISNEHHENSIAGYSLKEKKIYIDLDYFKKEEDSIFNKNILILDAIFHEIFHAYQHKYIDNNDDIKAMLFKAGFDYTVSESKEEIKRKYKSIDAYNIIKEVSYKIVYNKIYLSIPTERCAIYDANELLNNILKIIYDEYANEIIYNNNLKVFDDLNKNMIDDNKLFSPINTFLLFHDSMLIYEPVGKYVDDKDLTLEEKFKFGFSLSEGEYKKFKLQYFYPEL